jgi:sterol desaturase/sphingolipid hydroxylase (fatty acid hydroxylase superfamily)
MSWQLRGALSLALNGGAFPQSNWLYNLDFVVYPLVVGICTALDCRSWTWSGLAALGFLLFTLVEYWVHRTALHVLFYHATHERHHTHPREYVVFPIYYIPAVFALAFLMLPVPVFAGFTLGYVWFFAWHHVLHHVDLNTMPRVVRRYAIWHLAHHHDETCNFGITVPLWDVVFRTYRRT